LGSLYIHTLARPIENGKREENKKNERRKGKASREKERGKKNKSKEEGILVIAHLSR
jgi:hypothetical protein